MQNNNKPATGTEVTEQVQRLAKAFGDQIVRRDNKFFDVENLGVPLSRNDVERMILNRVRDEYSDVPLSKELVKGLDLSRNCSAPLTWYLATKEKHHGIETNPGVPRRSSARSVDQRAAA